MRAWTLIATVLALGSAAGVAQGATIAVTTTADTTAADGLCSLREAVFAARFNASVLIAGCVQGSATGADVITLGAGTYELLPGAFGTEDGNESGDIDTGPSSALRVVGQGAGLTIIDPLLGDRAFDVFPGSSLGLENLTIRRGRASVASPGGAVRNQGTLTAVRVAFEGNQAGAGLAGVPDERVGGDGGAIWSGNAATGVVVGDSTFIGNTAGSGAPGFDLGPSTYFGGNGGSGSAIAVASGTAEISGSTFSANRAGDGGEPGAASFSGYGGSGALAVMSPAAASVINSTFVGNIAGARKSKYPDLDRPAAGAAILLGTGGSLRISWSTFAGNARGPDAAVDAANGVANAQVSASILADDAPACRNVTTAGLPNVVRPGETSCNTPAVAGDSRLAPLASNGGPTPTLALGAGSAAINALAGVPCPGTDQRGLPRPALGACDAGAFEAQPGPAAPVAGGGGGAGGGSAGVRPRRITSLILGPSAFRAAGRGSLGTTARFRLDAAGTVVLTVDRTAAGRRSGHRCVAPARRLRKAKRCTRTITLPGSLTTTGIAGANAIRFSGKLRGRALAPGAYTLVLTLPRAGSAGAVTARTRFRIVR